MRQQAAVQVQLSLPWVQPACSTRVSPTSKPYPFFSHLVFLSAPSTFCSTSPCCWPSTLQHCPALLECLICPLTVLAGVGVVQGGGQQGLNLHPKRNPHVLRSFPPWLDDITFGFCLLEALPSLTYTLHTSQKWILPLKPQLMETSDSARLSAGGLH